MDSKTIWHKDIRLKVLTFSWRLFRNRLATNDNLLRRGVINDDSGLCVGGCGFLETTSHLFLHFRNFGSIWLGNFTVAPELVVNHLTQFGNLGGDSEVRQSIIHLIWFASVWKIWKERNNKILNGKEYSMLHLIPQTIPFLKHPSRPFTK
jgi:hypothetical protein